MELHSGGRGDDRGEVALEDGAEDRGERGVDRYHNGEDGREDVVRLQVTLEVKTDVTIVVR